MSNKFSSKLVKKYKKENAILKDAIKTLEAQIQRLTNELERCRNYIKGLSEPWILIESIVLELSTSL